MVGKGSWLDRAWRRLVKHVRKLWRNTLMKRSV